MMADIGIYNYNVGWSNKASTVKWHKIVESACDVAASIVVLTEVSSVKRIAALTKKFSDQQERPFDSIVPKIGYDRLALIYDRSKFTLVPPYEVSFATKTATFQLERAGGDGMMTVVAAHAPYKSNKRLDTLAHLNAMLGVAANPTLVIGDMNTGPQALQTALSLAEAIAITDNYYSTTETNTPAVDNMAVSSGAMQDVEILWNMHGSDHFPVLAIWGP